MNNPQPQNELSYICRTPDYLERLGDPWYVLLAQLQSTINSETHRFWTAEGLTALNLPITSGTISSPMGKGSDSLPVRIDLMGASTYLADSMQFALEYGCRLAHKGSYYVMPSFRGEEQDSSHLSQFFHSEAEVKTDLSNLLRMIESYLRHLCESIVSSHQKDLEKGAWQIEHIKAFISKGALPGVTFREAQKILGMTPNYFKLIGGDTYAITRLGEQELIKRFGGAVWITEMEHLSVPFYQAYCANKKYSKSADLLLGFGEVVGSGERHSNVMDLRRSLREHEVSPSEYEWYIRMKEVVPMQTAGFGLGIERFLMWVLNHADIRDMQILPRINGINLYP
jgi:asparaginyl-tRNA synthetase